LKQRGLRTHSSFIDQAIKLLERLDSEEADNPELLALRIQVSNLQSDCNNALNRNVLLETDILEKEECIESLNAKLGEN